MNFSPNLFNCLVSVLVFSLWSDISISAAEPTEAGSMASSNVIPLSPPRPPSVKPPVELFRGLLAMTPAERKDFLASRSADAQKLILAKVREDESLNPEQRELRLRVTELRWYLRPLLGTAATDRTVQLSAIPSDLRQLVDDRLQEWDKLSGEMQKKLLENESTLRFYFELATSTPDQRAKTVNDLPAAGREQIESGTRKWESLTEDQRQAIVGHFNRFFDLTPAEKDKTLRSLSEPERNQIQKTLDTFGNLTSAQRRECLRSFEKFASLSPEERQQFLKNAERWKLMTPSNRQTWKNLVYNLSRQPPVPPGLRSPQAPPLPQKGLLHPAPGSSGWATNSN